MLFVNLEGGAALGSVLGLAVAPHAFPPNSCQGVQACDGVTGTVGSNSCNGWQACLNMTGNVGNGSCHGQEACAGLTGSVGDRSCNGASLACTSARNVGTHSCNQFAACGQAGNIGKRSCNSIRACDYTENIGKFACNGGSNESVCEHRDRVRDCARNTPGFVPAPCFGTRSVMGTSAVPAKAGQPVKLWATVFARYPVVGKPGGTFRFLIDGRTLPNPVAIDRYGRAVITRTLESGKHWVSGRYLGDGTFAPSVPVPMLQFVVP
jgi:hypothetical protein